MHDPGCPGDDALGHIEHGHDDVESVGQNQNGAGRFEDPLEKDPVVQIMQVVLFDNELDQLIGGNKGEDQTGNRQYHRFRKLSYQGEHPGVPCRRGGSHLHRNLSDTGIDRIKKPCKVAHDTLDQQLF